MLRGLLPSAALVLLLACSDSAPGGRAAGGAELYRTQGCALCHGQEGEGSVQGPPLRGLSAHWTRDSLADYLADPRKVVERDERLKALASGFLMPMPASALLREARLDLADYALGLR